MGDGKADFWEAGIGNFATAKQQALAAGNDGLAKEAQNHIDSGVMKSQAYARAYDILMLRVTKPPEAKPEVTDAP